ncbi:peptide-methionine (S)-S-oxide reductase MsrA [uncultured Maricaulis sp.]|uniref:peptide-methionine (S)-S-oxide reductase MsrA n=1 Tax=uncultured Maricaulis sp. TaxID=174710 RepID=UPI0030D74B28
MTELFPTPDIITADRALPGRTTPITTASTHFVTGRPLKLERPEGMEEIFLAMGCFWGVERLFWQAYGVWHTAVGYAGGHTPNPTYDEACSGATGHAETARVIFDPEKIPLDDLLKRFWEGHDPTQGMRQGNDRGSQYRSAIYVTTPQQMAEAERSRTAYNAALAAHGRGPVTTELNEAGPFYYAEDYHQQYLAKNPGGYCGLSGTGVVCPIGTGIDAA